MFHRSQPPARGGNCLTIDLDQGPNVVQPKSMDGAVLQASGHPMATLLRTLLGIIVAVASLGAITERVREEGVTDTEIRIGNLMPYSGAFEVFGAIGKAEAAY